MSLQPFAKSDFKNYANKLKSELDLLQDFTLPPPNTWEIDWKTCLKISNTPSKLKAWNSIPIFSELQKYKANPGVYYFTMAEKHAKELHNAFVEMKTNSSLVRREKGLKDQNFFNISHTPKNFNLGSCIYVGSRKKEIHGRLIQHLGFGSSNRTGALYLYQVLSYLKIKPAITFHYHLFDKKYINLTEHIECVVQDKLKPFIGRRAIKEMKD